MVSTHCIVLQSPSDPLLPPLVDTLSSLTAPPLRTETLTVGSLNVAELYVSLEGGVEPGVTARIRELSEETGVDIALVEAGEARPARTLIVMDCDSTLINAEVIDELAAHAGRKEEVAAITDRAMHGELDFAQSLRERVACLEGIPETVFAEVASAIQFNPGALDLVARCNELGWPTAVASGGFTPVLDRLVARAGITYSHANELEVVDGHLTGRVLGEIVDKHVKAGFMRECAAREGLPLERVIAVGDGANDIEMVSGAGLGVAYMAKPALKEVADTSLNHGRLDGVLAIAGAVAR